MKIVCFKCRGCGKTLNVEDADYIRHKYYCPHCGKLLVEERKDVIVIEWK